VLSGSIFLIPNGTFLAELVLFLIVFGVLAKFVLPPIDAARRERAERVRSSLAAGDEGRLEAARLASERRQVLDAARAEARAIVEEAGREAAALVEGGRAAGRAEHDRILAEARAPLAEESRRVVAELSARMGALVLSAAANVVGQPLDASRHAALIDETVARARLDGGPGHAASNGAGGPAGGDDPAGTAGPVGEEGA
jgi:F-type H+-transporting ATPase subunit b